MSKKIIVLTIPGIGTQKNGYSEGLVEDLNRFTKGKSVNGNIIFMETRPFSVTKVDENQKKLFKRLEASNKLGGMFSLRQFVLNAFGDGVTFERNPESSQGPYQLIHHYLRQQFENAYAEMAKFDDAKLVIVAASMGVHLLSTYIWDADNNKRIFKEQPAEAKNNLTNLDFLASIGCNIPLFVSGYPEEKIKPFKKRNGAFTWDNYYDRDDVLGWPLEQLNDEYKELVTDYEINTGLYVGSHVKYWNDNDFTKPLSKKLNKLYEAM